ncbi:family 43 glycosylhydrolase, partial [candidate division KSB1 bacterium]|nr:family 43 glycosylhydrolase [candidate division KSB1 bacterium]
GTEERHSEVVFRSKKIDGPYVPYESNPILTQRHLDPGRANPITSTGHADLVETDSGEWWAVFLGCRPYPPVEDNHYNTGRETFLAPVRWIDGWPVINPDHQEVQFCYPFPIQPVTESSEIRYSGNFTIRDDFDEDKLDMKWLFLRTPRETWYDLTKQSGVLAMKLRPETCGEKVNPSFLGHRQQHQYGSATISMNFRPAAEYEKAGLLIFQNEEHYYFLCKSLQNNVPVIQLYKSGKGSEMELMASHPLDAGKLNDDIKLKIEAKGNVYSFSYAYDSRNWTILQDHVDATFLSTRTAGGFVGCIYSLYATSLGESIDRYAYFDWFEYLGDDKVYK